MQPQRVETIDDLTAVWRLTHDGFARAGLIKPQSARVLVHYPHLDTRHGKLYPETVVHTLEQDDKLVGTVSVTLDGPAGLHTDGIFADETNAIRRECAPRGLCLASSWRIVTEVMSNEVRAILTLLEAGYQDCLERGIDVVLATFHPRHVSFYRRVWGFTKVAGPRPENVVGGSPAVLMRADLGSELKWKKFRKRLPGVQ